MEQYRQKSDVQEEEKGEILRHPWFDFHEPFIQVDIDKEHHSCDYRQSFIQGITIKTLYIGSNNTILASLKIQKYKRHIGMD